MNGISQLLLAVIFIIFGSFVEKSSSLELVLEKIDHVGTKDYVDSSSMKIKRVGKDRKMFGKFVVKVPLNNSVQVKVSVSMKTGSGWNLLPYKIEKPACNFFTDDKYFYPDLVQFSNFPNSMPCPIPATAFEVNGWEPKLDNVPPMLLKNGDYKVVFNYFAGPKEIYTLVGFGSIINIYF